MSSGWRPKAPDVAHVLDAAYARTSSDDVTWLEGVVAALQPSLPASLGMIAALGRRDAAGAPQFLPTWPRAADTPAARWAVGTAGFAAAMDALGPVAFLAP